MSSVIVDDSPEAALDRLYRDQLSGSIVFDIETGPLPWNVIEGIVGPFIEPAKPGDFDPASVKVGNLGEEKAAAKIEKARAEHLNLVKNHEQNAAAARVAWVQDTQGRACLDPTIGQVLAIGYRDAGGRVFISRGDCEADQIQAFWKVAVGIISQGNSLIGHYIAGFDIPFLIRRSWILGIDVPGCVREGRYLSKAFIDTRDVWLCGQHSSSGGSSLDAIAKAFGVGSKPEGVSGADFWRLWQSGDVEQMSKALAYLANDLEMGARVAERMGVL